MQEVKFRLVVELDQLSRMRSKIELEEIGSGDLHFELSGRIVNPHGHTLVGVLDVESPLPGSENKAIRFEMQSGSWQPMGSWVLSQARDELIINAETEPKFPDGVLTIEFNAVPTKG